LRDLGFIKKQEASDSFLPTVDWRAKCRSAIASAIVTWPVELASIVADYAIRGVRWSVFHRNEGLSISMDGRKAARTDVPVRLYEHAASAVSYNRVIADLPLSLTDKRWILQLQAVPAPTSHYVVRIGVLAAADVRKKTVSKFVGPEIQFEGKRGGAAEIETADGRLVRYDNAADVRYCLQADLATGVLSATVWTTDRPSNVDLWFSIRIPVETLVDSFPVAYIFGPDAYANLVD
jgi:hypothetical protein